MLADRIKALGQLFLSSFRACAAKDAEIAVLKGTIANLESQLGLATDAANDVEAAVAEAQNPTPLEDEVVAAADASDVENTPIVQEAIDNTVGTAEPTTPEAVESAIEMLVQGNPTGNDEEE